MRTLIILSALAEAALLVGGGAYAYYRLRRRRRPGASDFAEADAALEPPRPPAPLGRLERAMTPGLPRPLVRLLMLEPRLWWCFGVWALRRVPRGPGFFPYRKRSPLGLLILVLLFTTPVEVLLLELLIPIFWIRLLLLVAAIYGLFFIVAVYASLVVLPHVATETGLLVRYGVLAELWAPFDRVARVSAERHEGPRGSLGIPAEGLSLIDEEAWFVVGGRTDVVLEFDRPLALARLRGDRPVRLARLAVDTPEALLEAVEAGRARATARREAATHPEAATRSGAAG